MVTLVVQTVGVIVILLSCNVLIPHLYIPERISKLAKSISELVTTPKERVYVRLYTFFATPHDIKLVPYVFSLHLMTLLKV